MHMRVVGRVKGKQSRRKYTYYFYAYKAKGNIWLEGISEFIIAYYLEFNDDILKLQSQPSTFTFSDHLGKQFTYTPDFIAFDIKKMVHLIIEAKTDAYQMTLEEQALLSHCFSKYPNTEFIHLAPCDIGPKERLDNYKLLHAYKKISPTQFLSMQGVKYLCGDALTFSDFRLRLIENDFNDALAYSFLAHKLATFDFDIPLTDKTMVEFI